MKEQRNFVRCFGIVFIVSLTLCVLLEFELDRYFILWCNNYLTGHRSFAVNLLIGVCSGAILAILTSWINYSSAKDKFITEFSEMCEDFCTALYKLPYLYFEADANLWAAYYCENCRNKLSSKSNDDGNSHGPAYIKLLDWYRLQYPQSEPELLLNRKKTEIDDSLSLVFKSYHEFVGFNFCAIERIMKTHSFIRCYSQQEGKVQEIFSYAQTNFDSIKSKVSYMQDFNALSNMIVQINKLQIAVFDGVKKSESVVFLPPTNKIEEHIRKLLRELNDTRGAKKDAKPTP